jgi:hypothetical protein
MTNTPVQPTESNPHDSRHSQGTLARFIDDNSKLVTSLAAFIALTAFSSQLENSDLKILFAALTFLAATLLGLELHSVLPDRPRHWRLEAFSLVLLILVASMGRYWFEKFSALWVPVLLYVIQTVVLLGLAVLLTYLLTETIKFITTKLFKREIRANVMLRVSRIVLVFCAALVVAGFFWTSRKLAAHPITIHFPKLSMNTDPGAALLRCSHLREPRV